MYSFVFLICNRAFMVFTQRGTCSTVKTSIKEITDWIPSMQHNVGNATTDHLLTSSAIFSAVNSVIFVSSVDLAARSKKLKL